MAKYLGGTDSQQEEVKAELITPGLLNNDFVLNVSTGIFSKEKIGIKDNISFYEEVDNTLCNFEFLRSSVLDGVLSALRFLAR